MQMPASTVLVTGTDTGVGKTWAACALARALRSAGRSVVAVKAVETGCADDPAPTEDGVRLAAATGQAAPDRALRRFRAPLAPALAADLEGGVLDLAQAFQATALVVASDCLGAINHTLLTLSALDLAGIRVAGIVLNAPAVSDVSTGANGAAIARLSGIERVRAVPRIAEPDAAVPWLVEVAGWL